MRTSNTSKVMFCQLFLLFVLLLTFVAGEVNLISKHSADILVAVYMLTAPGITLFFLRKEYIENKRELKKLRSSKKRTFESSDDFELANRGSFIEKVGDYIDGGVTQQKAIKQMKNILREQTGRQCDDAVEKLASLINKRIEEKFK